MQNEPNVVQHKKNSIKKKTISLYKYRKWRETFEITDSAIVNLPEILEEIDFFDDEGGGYEIII